METDRISEPRMIQGSPLKSNRQTVLHWYRLFIPASLCEAFHQNRPLREVQHIQPHLLPRSQTETEREIKRNMWHPTFPTHQHMIFTQGNIDTYAYLGFRLYSHPFLWFTHVNGGVRFQIQAVWCFCGLVFLLICWTQMNNPKALQGWITMFPSLEAGVPHGVAMSIAL